MVAKSGKRSFCSLEVARPGPTSSPPRELTVSGCWPRDFLRTRAVGWFNCFEFIFYKLPVTPFCIQKLGVKGEHIVTWHTKETHGIGSGSTLLYYSTQFSLVDLIAIITLRYLGHNPWKIHLEEATSWSLLSCKLLMRISMSPSARIHGLLHCDEIRTHTLT